MFCGYHLCYVNRIICGKVWISLPVGVMAATPSTVTLITGGSASYWYSVEMNIGALENGLYFTVIT